MAPARANLADRIKEINRIVDLANAASGRSDREALIGLAIASSNVAIASAIVDAGEEIAREISRIPGGGA